MTELKTLNDFNKIRNQKIERQEIVKELKAEAIKWLKHSHQNIEVRDWIRFFFNITEDDLKDAPPILCEDCNQKLDYYENNQRWCLPCYDTKHKEENSDKNERR